jgi:hydrophobe/amphiphile efflux-1 (HAE1) family protein
MWITKVSINNPVFATMVMVGLCVLGIFSYGKLGVEQLPDITIPVVTISVIYPGASPEAVENDITKPIENAVNAVAGIKTLRSSSFEGDSETSIEFKVGTNVDRVIQEVRDKVAQVRPTFPREAKEPLIARADTENAQPVVQLAVTSSTRDLKELSTLTDQVIVKELQKTIGVGRVGVAGNRARQVRILVHPEQLAAYGIAIDQVMDAIRNSNQDIPAGQISNSATEAVVRVDGKLKNIDDFRRIVVARRGAANSSSPVYLSEVADVSDGVEEATTISRLDGQPAVGLNVFKVQDANIVETGHAVRAAVARMKDRLPQGVNVVELYSNADWVSDSLRGVKETLLEGGVLTIFIVFLFLRSWRSTIITGLTLPIAVISSFIALYMFGFTLNFMTMMALSLCVGLLIDDAIVVRENIVRHLRMGKSHLDAAREGTEEIGLAVMATTFAIVAVFVPVAFMSGIFGKFFFPFGVTVTVAVLISLFVSFTLDPMLSSRWVDPPQSRVTQFAPIRIVLDFVERNVVALHESYHRALGWSLEHRRKTLLIALALFFGSFALFPLGLVGSEFIPDVDESYISLRLTTPVGSSLEYADQKTSQVERLLTEFKEIKHADVDIFGDSRGVVRIDLMLVPRGERKRSQKELEKAIRDRLSHVAGVQTSIGYEPPIYIAVLGPDVEKLNKYSADFSTELSKIPGVVDMYLSNRPGVPAISVRPNPDVASDLGLTTASIGNALAPLVGGETVTYWLGPDGQNYGVRVQLPRDERTRANTIGDLMLSTNKVDGNGNPRLVPLRQVASVVTASSPEVIKRQDLQRRVAVYANIENRDKGAVGTDIAKLVEATSKNLPPGYSISIGGQQQQQDESVGALFGALTLAVIFIYLVLASQFGSFLQPVAIMASLPLSLIGVLLALAFTGSTVNLFSMIGFVMLMGLVTKNAILLVDFANRGQAEGMSQHDALMRAGEVRLRPILMTTAAMVFGMLPLALGLGEGSEQQSPMGRAIIGGVLTSTLLTLVVVPVLYSYLDVWGRRFNARYREKTEKKLAQMHRPASEVVGGGGPVSGQPAAPHDHRNP